MPLVINWDQTGLNFVPYAEWTMDVKGSRRVEVAGLKDKRQMTAVFAGSADGNFLPPQLIYSGTTTKCLPRNVKFPSEWHVTSTTNHWSNEDTMFEYIDRIIAPYIQSKRQELDLASDHKMVKNKMVKAFSNVQNLNRCVVTLYQKYMALFNHIMLPVMLFICNH